MTTHEETEVGQGNPETDPRAEGTDRSPSGEVLRAVAAASGRSLVRSDDRGEPLEPLYHAVDPDALDALIASMPGDTPASGRIEFTYGGYHVVVDGAGRVEVRER